MFEDALLDSSAQNQATLRRVHYLISAIVGITAFALGHYLLPFIFLVPGARALASASASGAVAIGFFTLMVCYVGVDARRQHLQAWAWIAMTLLLNLPGFLIYLVWSARKSGDWRRAAMPLAYVAESLVVGALVLVPMIHMQALPARLALVDVPGPPYMGHPQVTNAGNTGRPIPQHNTANPFEAPPRIPDGISQVADAFQHPTSDGPSTSGVDSNLPTGGPTGPGVPWGAPWSNAAPPPPAPTPHIAPKPTLYRQGGEVTAARALYQPRPVYPRLAIMAHIQGTVVLQAILSTDGSVQDLKVVSGHPLLVQAALDAVKTWRYQPTLLNSEPVEVLTEIDVNFKLDE